MISCPLNPGCNCDPSEPCPIHKSGQEVRDLSYWKRRIVQNPFVKIERCSDPMMWYASKVGQDILIERVDREGLWAREGGEYNAINIVRFADV